MGERARERRAPPVRILLWTIQISPEKVVLCAGVLLWEVFSSSGSKEKRHASAAPPWLVETGLGNRGGRDETKSGRTADAVLCHSRAWPASCGPSRVPTQRALETWRAGGRVALGSLLLFRQSVAPWCSRTLLRHNQRRFSTACVCWSRYHLDSYQPNKSNVKSINRYNILGLLYYVHDAKPSRPLI